jgi:hypothetical protein
LVGHALKPIEHICSQGSFGNFSMDHWEGLMNAAFVDTEDSFEF